MNDINELRQFNASLQNDEDIPQFNLYKVDSAINTTAEMIAQQARIFDAIECIWYKQGLDIRGASLSYFMADVHSALEKSK